MNWSTTATGSVWSRKLIFMILNQKSGPAYKQSRISCGGGHVIKKGEKKRKQNQECGKKRHTTAREVAPAEGGQRLRLWVLGQGTAKEEGATQG